jgi:hypothetical protein
LALAESLVFKAQHLQTPSDLRLRFIYFDIALQYVTLLTLWHVNTSGRRPGRRRHLALLLASMP